MARRGLVNYVKTDCKRPRVMPDKRYYGRLELRFILKILLASWFIVDIILRI